MVSRDLEAENLNQNGAAIQELERQLSELDDPADQALLLGDALVSLGGLDEAEAAYMSALSHRPDDGDILVRLAEVNIFRAEGIVNASALEWVVQALIASPGHPAANFYQALYDYQQGHFDDAVMRLNQMLISAPADAPWTGQVSSLLVEIETAAAQVGAFAEMDDVERETTIRAMVEQLATRLEGAPDDFDGWLRLANAYAVLGEQDAAQNALARARILAQGEDILERRVQEVADSLSNQ